MKVLMLSVLRPLILHKQIVFHVIPLPMPWLGIVMIFKACECAVLQVLFRRYDIMLSLCHLLLAGVVNTEAGVRLVCRVVDVHWSGFYCWLPCSQVSSIRN